MKRGGQGFGWYGVGAGIGYWAAVVGTALAGSLRWLLGETVGDVPPFITFYPVAVISAALGGVRPGLLATVLVALTADFFFLEPRGSFALSSKTEIVSLTIFFAVNALLSIVGGRLRLSHQTAREQAQLAHLRADATQALQEPAALSELLQKVAAMLVDRLEAAFARIWTLDASGQMLELQASAGLYTHLNGPHGRVPVGQLKIGRIAAERRPHVTNRVVGDPNIPAQDWARRERLVAFAGMPLLLEDRLLGVLAVFARHPISAAAVETFAAVSGALAQAIARRQAEEALRVTREELAQANASLERKVEARTAELQETVTELEHFSYTITHDMRAPLRAMRALAGLLVKDWTKRDSPEHRDYLRRIAEAAERMDRLIVDALQYSGVVRQRLELEPVDAGELLSSLLETYPQFQRPNADISIETNIPMVLGNKAAMTQCFSNLLGNAVKFVRPDEVPQIRVWAEQLEAGREIEAASNEAAAWEVPTGTGEIPSSFYTAGQPRSVAPSGAHVRIWFEDKGIGIEKEDQDKIWAMFHKLDKRYEGTGIGLALVRKAVERMGGRVGVISESQRGSRFWVELKRAIKEPEKRLDQVAHSE